MDFGSRKRRRKSQSFKLVTDEDCDPPVKETESKIDNVWLGDDGMEIKKQITGMMRLLNDKTSRVYQRVEVDHEGPSPGDRPAAGLQSASKNQTVSSCTVSAGASSSSNISDLIPSDNHDCMRSADCSTRKDVSIRGINAASHHVQEHTCCTCSCKGTLNSILYELQAMRRLMQAQKEGLEPEASLHLSPEASSKREEDFKGDSSNEVPASPQEYLSSELKEPQETLQSAVRLAEDFDVLISKAQLKTILVNYTRSGSLLFRKLVCAFFNDATLANSLPNGKRKRGLNDKRKGLDQNIVGAIKVFTEKYCTEHKIPKIPSQRDWVQILQDQIKLARRRLKREKDDPTLIKRRRRNFL